MYDHYKPLRNFSRKLHQEKSLLQIWFLMQNLRGKRVLPGGFMSLKNGSINGFIHEWELAILAREIILNSGESEDRSLEKLGDLITGVNLIRGIAEEQSRRFITNSNVLHEMHRISQQQFPFQENNFTIYRFLKIFRHSNLGEIFRSVTGLSINKFFFLAISVAGAFIKRPAIKINIDYSSFGITNEERDIFFGRFTTRIQDLKKEAEEHQEYNENWSYTFNPFKSTPLILFSEILDSVYCPIVDYFNSRISEGLVFDIYKQAKGSEEAYGRAFESYVFDVSNRLITSEKIIHLESQSYNTGKGVKHGADFCLTDNTIALIVECKAKRLNLDSRYKGDGNSLAAELKKLSEFIVQNYKNLLDVRSGKSKWNLSGALLRPVIVSLMQWYIWTPEMREKLEGFVKEGLSGSNIDADIIQTNPYIVMSIEDYEAFVHVINQVGLSDFFEKVANPKYSGWSIKSIIINEYSTEIKSFNSKHLHSDLRELLQEFDIGGILPETLQSSFVGG